MVYMKTMHSTSELNFRPAWRPLAAALLMVLIHAGAGAADKNPASAMEAYQAKNYDAALRLWQPSAARGDAEAQYSLGVMHANGEGVAKDPAAAVAWYRKAADQGHGRAQFNLGLAYRGGQGVEKSEVQAVDWFRRSAESGYPDGQLAYGLTLMGAMGVAANEAEAMKWLTKAAAAGHPKAQHLMGLANLNGFAGMPKDAKEAVRLFQLAAKQGELESIYLLGVLNPAHNRDPNDPQAVKWVMQAANLGYAQAQYDLAGAVRRGEERGQGRKARPRVVHEGGRAGPCQRSICAGVPAGKRPGRGEEPGAGGAMV